MKIDINIARNGDGNPCVVVSSPYLDDMVIKEIDEGNFEYLSTGDNLENIMETLAEIFKPENREARNVLEIECFKHKTEKGKFYNMVMVSGEYCGSVTSMTKKEYKLFCRRHPLYKLETAYKVFKEQIDQHVIPENF